MRPRVLSTLLVCLLAACRASGEAGDTARDAEALLAQQAEQRPFMIIPIAKYNEPCAMTFLPDGRFLVTEKQGRLRLEAALEAGIAKANGNSIYVEGVPKVDYGGQGGLGDDQRIRHASYKRECWIRGGGDAHLHQRG